MEPVILYQDDDILVVDKPAGMIVHPVAQKPGYGAGPDGALDETLRKKFREIFLVHRIDRETSGVLIIARTEAAHAHLKEQFQNREVKKTYRAFVYGNLKDERGIIDKPIGSARGGTAPRSATQPYGRERTAVTTWRRIENGPACAYVEVFPQTGRTHQIRVHFSSIQHPIVADRLYAPSRAPILGFERLALHALSVAFVHPTTGQELKFEAPLPPDFVAAEAKLQSR